MTQKDGISTAFLFFAADEAVLFREQKLIVGKTAIKESFEKSKKNSIKVSLAWEPDFVDVSASGDLGYTYGKFVYTTVDSLGVDNSVEGVFHTVWKRQKHGEWRFVWD